MKLLHKFSGVMAIFFPVGKTTKGGTCEFATEQCLKECAAFKFATKDNKIPYKNKLDLYKAITTGDTGLVVDEIVKEMKERDVNILYWFASGDCQKKYTQRIFNIMRHISLEGIVQQGFTRNIVLWRNALEIENMNMVLTVESGGKISDDMKRSRGLFAEPDFKTGKVKIFQYYWEVTEPRWEYYCGGSFTRPTRNKATTGWSVNDIEKGPNCQLCYDKKKGCYTLSKGTVETQTPR